MRLIRTPTHVPCVRFAYAVIAANQLVASTNAIRFHYDDGTTFLNWPTGENVDHAVWFGMVLVAVTMFNMLPVRVSAGPPQ